jgi:hypothetical protein
MVIASAVLIQIDRASVAVSPLLSVTTALKLYVPSVVGVPEIAPVDESSDRPVGNAPDDIDQL